MPVPAIILNGSLNITPDSPLKNIACIVKFKNAVELLRNTTFVNLLTTAIDAGYYDLAHFSKEIKTLSGNTPSSFLSLTVPEDITLTYIEP